MWGNSGTVTEERMQFAQHRPRVLEDVVARVPPDAVTAREGLAFAATIQLPCVPRSVKRVAVELDGQTVLWPAAVDAPRARDAIHPREREPFRDEEFPEPPLDLAQRDVGITVKDPSQPA